jgi:tripartite-type tricarboxylate transporter receptor subunit TctC
MAKGWFGFTAGACAAMASAALAPSVALAQGASQPPKELNIVVGFGAGGVYHSMSMLLSRHMGRKMPGNPPAVVKVMPGAGSILAANYLFNVAPADGSTIGAIGGGLILEPMFRNPEAKYDPARFHWIGTSSSETYTCVAMKTKGVSRIEQAIDTPLAAGSTGRGSRTFTYAQALNDLMGTKIKVITGYRGLPDIHLAMERGELDAVCGWGYSSIFSQKPDWVKDDRINILLQFGLRKNPAIPNVPLILDVLQKEEDKAAMRLLVLDSLIAWPVVAPPGVSKENVALLRRAYNEALADPALQAEAKQVQIAIEPVSGEDIERAIADALKTPPAIVERARKLSGLD